MLIIIGMSEKKNPMKNPLSPLIKYVENTPGSHLYLKFSTSQGGLIYESVFPRVRRIAEKDWLKENRVVREFEFEIQAPSSSVRQFLMHYQGKPYSFLQLVLIYLTKIDSAVRRYFIKHNMNKGRALICSEFVARFLTTFFGIQFGESFDTIGLKEVYDALLKLENKK